RHEMDRYAQLWNEYGYNAWYAERMHLTNQQLDVRAELCANHSYSINSISSVAVVLIFRNEQLAMLLRTLYSIVLNEDWPLVDSLLLIDDHSDAGMWQQQLSRDAFDEYVKLNIFRDVRIFHMEESMGVVRARRFAVRELFADIVIFMDAHVEVTAGWLAPLLHVVAEDPTTIATPQLDRLDEQSLEYVLQEPHRGLFDWTLRRREVALLPEQLKQLPRPYEMPVARTAVFAVERVVFSELAHFDMELNAPAAAELELSLKYWCASGRVLVVPCSRVAHLERSDRSYLRRYGNVDQMGVQLFRSYKRLVEIWIPEPNYRNQIYQYQPQIQTARLGNVSALQQRFEQFGFKSFPWFIQHVASDLLQHFPLTSRKDFAGGSLRAVRLPGFCLSADRVTGAINMTDCSRREPDVWTLSYMQDLRLGSHSCLEVQPHHAAVALQLCHTLGGQQHWRYEGNNSLLVSNSHCLQCDQQMQLQMATCNASNMQQKWSF
ncbi:hypothetical protein KR222_003573, partial [Zaprionus bogoriensis]